MKNNIKIEDIDVVILCGGKGKRLQPVVSDRPKALAEINGRPFLDILIDYVASFGFRRFILCIGYMGELIKQYYHQKRDNSLMLVFSEEKEALGTAGAIKNAESNINSSPFLVMNGDSFCKIDLNEFLNSHTKKKALFSIVLSDMKDGGDYGKVVLDDSERICGFDEKANSKSNNSLTNAGMYMLDKAIFSEIPENKKCSLEYEIFPKLVNQRFYGFITEENFVDIGTPERFKQAEW